MTAFAVTAIVMLTIACAFVLFPLLRKADASIAADEASNLAVLRDQRAELEADRANGVLSAEQFEIARSELERRVLDETSRPAETSPPARAGAWTAAVVGAGLPIAALALYLTFGTPAALLPELSASQASGQSVTPQEIDTLIERVKERLASRPDDVDGWRILARTYFALGRVPEALAAYERATVLAPNDADLLADYADALASSQNRSLDGKPETLIERSLRADPMQWKANALAGTLAFQRGEYAKAIDYWERVKRTMPADSPVMASIDAGLAQARERTQQTSQVRERTQQTSQARERTQQTSQAPGPGIAGTVSLAPAIASGAAPDDTVFVFARPADGTRMPLALVRARVRDLPLTFTLDDASAMVPDRKLSDHASVVVGARVSRSGNATPQSGDLEASLLPAKLGERVTLVIDRKLP